MSRYGSIVGFPYSAGIGPYNFDEFDTTPNTRTTINENNALSPPETSISFLVKTHGIKSDYKLYWSTETVTGTITSANFADTTLTGEFFLNVDVNGIGDQTISRTLSDDSLTDTTPKSFRIVIRLGNPITGGIMIKSKIITINDTSLTPLSAIKNPGLNLSSVGSDAVAVVGVDFNLQTISRVTGGFGSGYNFTNSTFPNGLSIVGFPAGFAQLTGIPKVTSMTPVTYTVTANQIPQIPYQYAAPSSVSFTLAVATTLVVAYKDVTQNVTRWLPPNRTITPFIPVQGTGGWIGYPAGTKPLQYSYTNSTMPAGYTFSPTTGEISGSNGPTGALTFVVKVQDWATNPQSSTKQFTMRVANALASTTSLTNLILVKNTFVSFQPIRPAVTVNAPIASYSMPSVNGLSINPTTGVISGTPTAVLAANDYTVTITDICQPVQSITPTFNMGFCEVLTTSPQTIRYIGVNRTIISYTPVQPSGGQAPVTQTITSIPALRGTLALNPTTWLLSGTAPSTPDTSPITYTVRTEDSSTGAGTTAVNQKVDNTFQLQVVPALVGTVDFPIRVFVVNLTIASYSPISVNTTTPSRTFTVRTGTGFNALPQGLTMSSAGLVSGKPLVAQTAPQSLVLITLSIQDQCSPVQSLNTNNTFQVGVAPALTVSVPSSIVYLRASTATSFQAVNITGGWTPTGFPLTVTTSVSLTLVGSLTIDGTGVISGTAGAVGSRAFTVTVAESSTNVYPTPQTKTSTSITLNVVGALTITVNIPTVVLAIGTSLGAGITPIQVTGGSPIKNFITSTLPAGLNPINSTTGVITGTPTGPVAAAANRTFTIADQCVPISNNVRSISFQIVSAMTLASSNPPTLYEGVAVTAFTPVTATGGTTTKSFAMDPTTPLPNGLTINASTGQITGTPAGGKINNVSYTVVVTDACTVPQVKSASFTMNILGKAQQVFDTPGNFTYVIPAGVTSISAVAVGGGGGGGDGLYTYSNQFNDVMCSAGGGGGGGALAYTNNIPVTPGQTIYITVGAGGSTNGNGAAGGNSFVSTTSTSQASAVVAARGGSGGSRAVTVSSFNGTSYVTSTQPWSGLPGAGGTVITGTGGSGGTGGKGFQAFIDWTPPNVNSGLLQTTLGSSGGGGAGGYTGNGGTGGWTNSFQQWLGINASPTQDNNIGQLPFAGSGGGGGGGGARNRTNGPGGNGGGVGILGLGTSGAAGAITSTVDNTGGTGSALSGTPLRGYGGGGAGGGVIAVNASPLALPGVSGAVRVVLNGNTRQYPSTNLADQWF